MTNFKLININLWKGGILFDDLVEYIKHEDPDILTCQEVYNGEDLQTPKNYRTIQEFNRIFPEYNYSFAPAFKEIVEYGKIENGNAVFTRFEIVNSEIYFYDVPYCEEDESKTTDFSRQPRNLQYAELSLNGKALHLFNTQGIWGFDGLDNQRRLEMADTIIDIINNKHSAILCGDLNVDQNTKTIAKIEKKLKNVFSRELQSTFNLEIKKKEGFSKAVVDMIFVGQDIKVLNHYCSSVSISDHLPLVANLQIN